MRPEEHIDDDGLERLRHRELAPAAELSVREHVTWCTDCSRRLAAAEREEDELQSLLRRLDHPPPRVSVESIARRARAHDARSRRWAAAIVLGLVFGGVAYAAPGSPISSWIRAFANRTLGAPTERRADPPTQAPSVAGIGVAPGRELLIVFSSASPRSGQAIVTLTDDTEVLVRAPLGSATFTTDVKRLVIEQLHSTTAFEIRIPRAASRVAIEAGGRTIFLKEHDRIATAARLEGGSYRLSLEAPR